MIHQTIKKVCRTNKEEQVFSLLIPSWNNLPYLKLCINSIMKHSRFQHQIIVLVNEGKDGTREWVEQQKDIDYVYAEENIGICYGLNACRSLIKTNYVVYINDDMYMLPGWDLAFKDEIQSIGHNNFMLSGTMIEPYDTGNSCVIIRNYGDRLENFREKALITEFESLKKTDWSGSTWPPLVVSLDMWDLVGGMSTEFSPGMYSDPDLSMKFWNAGVRYFKGVSKSRAYHFGSKSTGRVRKNEGRKRFIQKYGISPRSFLRYYLKRGENFGGFLGEAQLPLTEQLLNKIKLIKYIFQ